MCMYVYTHACIYIYRERELHTDSNHVFLSQTGGCSFHVIVNHTPRKLQLAPYHLFDQIAVPLYPFPEHRAVSLRSALRSMGATPVAAGRNHAMVQLSRGASFFISEHSLAERSFSLSLRRRSPKKVTERGVMSV